MFPASRAIWAIGLILVTLQLPIELAASDVPAVHSYDLEYIISNANDYRDFEFIMSGPNSDGNISLVPDHNFKSNAGLTEFRLNAIKKTNFNEREFMLNEAAYIENNTMPSNSTFPSSVDYVASNSVLPDRISIILAIDKLNTGGFNISKQKALYHYPDGYQEEVYLHGMELPFPPHHYSRRESGGFEYYSTVLILLISTPFLKRWRRKP